MPATEVNVTANPFLADRTGASDARTAIQGAINSLGADGGVVYFPAGFYLINHADGVGLSLPAGKRIRLRGDGMVSSVLKFGPNLTGSGVVLSGLTRCSVERLGFDGSASVSGTPPHLLHLQSGCQFCAVRHCRFFDFNAAGQVMVQFSDVNDCVVAGCHFDTCDVGLKFKVDTLDAKRNVCRYCDFKRFSKYAFMAEVAAATGTRESLGFSIRACRFSKPSGSTPGNAMKAIVFTGTKNGTNYHRSAIVANNVVTGSGSAYATNQTGDQIVIENVKGGTITGNICTLGGGNGLVVAYSRDLALNGNFLDRNSENGLLLWGALDASVTGNVCTNNGQQYGGALSADKFGITVKGFTGSANQDSSGNLFFGNVCTDLQATKTQSYGLYLYPGGTAASVKDNQFGCNAFAGNNLGEVGQGQVPASNASTVTGTLELDPRLVVVDLIVDVSLAGTQFDVATIPKGAYIRSCRSMAATDVDIVGEATSFGIGVTGSPSLYGQSNGVTKNSKSTKKISVVPLANPQAVRIYGLPAGKNLGGNTGDRIRVNISYEAPIADLTTYS